MKDSTDKDVMRLTELQIFLVIVLILLSMITKFNIFSVEISGGPPLLAIAALIILWPLFREMAIKGGTAELLGLKVQVEKLERHTERDNAVLLEAVRTDLEELRQRLNATSPTSSEPQQILQKEQQNKDSLKRAIEDYRKYQDIGDWRARVEIDKRLIAGAIRLPTTQLREFYESASNDRETAMAVSMALALPHPSNNDVEAANLLTDLLQFPSERVRYRAALSMDRRGRRVDTSHEARCLMLDGIRLALKTESADRVREILDKAKQDLSNLI